MKYPSRVATPFLGIVAFMTITLLGACTTDPVTGPADPGYRSIRQSGRSAQNPELFMIAAGCTKHLGPPTKATIGIPIPGGEVATFNCDQAPGDSVRLGIQRFAEASRSMLSGANASAGYTTIRVYLGTREYCDRTVIRQYANGELVSEEIIWHEGTCRFIPSYIEIRVPVDVPEFPDPWLTDGGGGGGIVANLPPAVANPDSVATDSLTVAECFVREHPSDPYYCYKKFKPHVLDSLRGSRNYLRPLEEIPDTLARRECSEVQAYFNILMAADTLLFMGTENSPLKNPDGTIVMDDLGYPRMKHVGTTAYPDPNGYGKVHIEPYYVQRFLKSTTPGTANRAVLRFLLHEAVHAVTRQPHLEVPEGTENPIYTSPYFRTIESRDPNKSCIVLGTEVYVP